MYARVCLKRPLALQGSPVLTSDTNHTLSAFSRREQIPQMQPYAKNPLEPHLRHSSLFAKNLPGHVKDDEIRRIFRDFPLLRINIISAEEASDCSWKRHIWGEKGGTKAAQIQFPSIAIAEKAFAILNLRVIPDSNPPIVLMLSPSRDQSPIMTFSGYPRLVKLLPFYYTDLELYTLIRRFGPLASARVDDTLGGIVQFWNEDDARAAEIAIYSAFAGSLNITLQAYDPRNILCANLSPNVDELRLKNLFKKFGLVTSVRVKHNSKDNNNGYGLVSLFSPDEAYDAIHALHGTCLDSKELVLRYHEPKTSSKCGTQPTSEAEVAGSKDQSTSTGSQRTSNDTNVSSRSPTSSPSEEGERAKKAKLEAEFLQSERKKSELREQENRRILEEKARKEREETERKIAEEKEKARLKEEERLKNWEEATRAEQDRCRARDNELWGHVPWADRYALQRVLHIGHEFQKLKFSEEQPLVFESIPWPVLGNPTVVGVDDITWDNVEAFFTYVKISQEAVKYKKLLEILQRLFHPDKWRARKALETVMDASIRQSLEKAGNIVSQAVTPLWRAAKDEEDI